MNRELLQQALDALSWIANVNAMDYEYQRKARDSIKTIEKELAKPEQDLSVEANRVAYDVAMHYANKTKEKNS